MAHYLVSTGQGWPNHGALDDLKWSAVSL